jgi:hypothetical protein
VRDQVKAFGSATGSAVDLDILGRLMNRTSPPMRDQAQVLEVEVDVVADLL